MTREKRKLCLAAGLIFFTIYILNHFMVRGAGDDYVYSFMWEGHSMYVPLSEDARRIAGFADIAASAWLYFLTWGGRVVAQSLAMFFLWMPREIFAIAIGMTAVLLVFLIQWIAKGKMTWEVSSVSVLLTAFGLWALQAHFVGVFIWLDGSCNYLWPMVFLLAWLLPYVRQYLHGPVDYGPWMTPAMFILGLLAGNGNENTLCWIGLFGIFYLFYLYTLGELTPWMVAGFVGLSIGYGILMLSPGNFVRMEQSGETLDFFRVNNKAIAALWFYSLLSSYFYFYLLKGYRKRKQFLAFPLARKYLRLVAWFFINSLLFGLIMYFSPEFPLRSLFPSTIFTFLAVFTLHELEKKTGVCLTPRGVAKNLKRLAVIYFICTFSTTLWWFVANYNWFQGWADRAEAMRGSPAVLEITELPPYDTTRWNYLTGVHTYTLGITENKDNWGNVAMAKFYGIGGVRMVRKEE